MMENLCSKAKQMKIEDGLVYDAQRDELALHQLLQTSTLFPIPVSLTFQPQAYRNKPPN